jgi:thioesterase domain-containing protein
MSSSAERGGASGRAGEHRDASDRLERYLQAQIPLSKAMGVRVLRADESGVLLRAPLKPNVNHRQTFFGGSAAALATLAAWGLARERLLEQAGLDVHLVIQRSSMEYLEPAAAEVEAECASPADKEWDRLIRTVRRRGKGRIELRVELRAEGAVVGSFEGSFVAFTEG